MTLNDNKINKLRRIRGLRTIAQQLTCLITKWGKLTLGKLMMLN